MKKKQESAAELPPNGRGLHIDMQDECKCTLFESNCCKLNLANVKGAGRD